MKFETITPEIFRKFADKSAYKSFTQTPEIASLREKQGWVPYYFAATENGQIRAAALVLAKPTFLGKSTFICPGGPLMDYENAKLVTFFLKNLKDFAKTHNGYTLQISPYYELMERDRHGEVTEGGFDHSAAIGTLKSLKFAEIPHASQPKYLFVLNIDGCSPAELMANFKSNTRGHIKKAEKMGVKIRELSRAELPILKKITESTSKRRGFTDRPLSYYEKMYDLFADKGEVKFLVAEVSKGGQKASENVHERPLSDNGSERSEAPPVTTGRRERVASESFSTPNATPLSAAMFMLYGDEVIYLFSGSDEKYMKDYNAQYLIQWYMIDYAARHKFKKYNFYGINGLPDKKSKDYGIYDFKKGFGGHVVELLGTFETPVNNFFYRSHRLLSRLKSKL